MCAEFMEKVEMCAHNCKIKTCLAGLCHLCDFCETVASGVRLGISCNYCRNSMFKFSYCVFEACDFALMKVQVRSLSQKNYADLDSLFYQQHVLCVSGFIDPDPGFLLNLNSGSFTKLP
jgi:hypothetical protein